LREDDLYLYHWKGRFVVTASVLVMIIIRYGPQSSSDQQKAFKESIRMGNGKEKNLILDLILDPTQVESQQTLTLVSFSWWNRVETFGAKSTRWNWWNPNQLLKLAQRKLHHHHHYHLQQRWQL
jgi:hypothetical protein